jgi:uncharacterized protein YkwD
MRVSFGARGSARTVPSIGRRARRSAAAAAIAFMVLISLVVWQPSAAQAVSYSAQELEFLRLINDYRQQNGVTKLLLSDSASQAAEYHSSDMARYRFFSHTSEKSDYFPVGFTFVDRMNHCGYTYSTSRGENIAAGQTSAAAVFAAWKGSSGHNANMLSANFKVVGIGMEYVSGSPYGYYWTTDFGGYVDPSAHDPFASTTTTKPPTTTTTAASTTTTTAPLSTGRPRILAGGPNSYLRVQSVFWFNGSAYRSSTPADMVAGRGYWTLQDVTGGYLTTDPTATSLSLIAGWNLIGNATGVSRSLPSGVVAYRFNGSSYYSSSQIPAGEGAWLRRSTSGTLTLR